MGKNHVIFACEECEKEFKYEAVLGKHRESVHEDTKFDCHYFNNDKECPFEDQCIYLQEESDKCKFNDNCERKMCMFRDENENLKL